LPDAALAGDAEIAESGEGAFGEAHSAVGALIGQDFAVGEAGGVVDGDMPAFPPRATLVALSSAIAGDAMADTIDADQPFQIELDHLNGLIVLVADDLRLGVQHAEPTQAEAAQDGADGGAGHAELAGDGGSSHAPARLNVAGGEARILVEVRPRLPERAVDGYGNHSFIPWPWGEKLSWRLHLGVPVFI
jgi:hypothetical protein